MLKPILDKCEGKYKIPFNCTFKFNFKDNKYLEPLEITPENLQKILNNE
jgi:hypothetical protein